MDEVIVRQRRQYNSSWNVDSIRQKHSKGSNIHATIIGRMKIGETSQRRIISRGESLKFFLGCESYNKIRTGLRSRTPKGLVQYCGAFIYTDDSVLILMYCILFSIYTNLFQCDDFICALVT